MKITDGLWLKRAGAEIRPAVEVAEVAVDEKAGSFELLIACKHVADRGATLGGPLLTLKLESVMEDVVKVNVTHFKGIKKLGPNFDLFPDEKPASPNVQVKETDESVSLTSGSLTVSVDKSSSGFNMAFSRLSSDGTSQTISTSGFKGVASLNLPPKIYAQAASETSVLSSTPYADPSAQGMRSFMQSEMSLSVGEKIYGFGELFGPLVKNGQTISVWNQDGGTSSEQGYKTIPFYLSSKGYGVFINTPGEVSMEVGAEKGSKVGTIVQGEELEYWLINGPSLKEVLGRYTVLTGRPGLPPAWSFGLWLSTSFTTDYSQNTVSGFLKEMKERDCPVGVVHLDCFWMAKYRWCDFTFDPDSFPDPAAYLAQIKQEYGVKVCVWLNPFIAQQSGLFEEGVEGGYFIKRKNGDVWQWDLWQPGLAVVDFTNPAACEWYVSKLEGLLDMGVDAFKTDFAERIPHVDVVFHSGGDPYRVHNWYAQKYNSLVFDLLERRFGKKQAVLFARAATAGGQRFPVHWGGDCESTFEAMAESLRGGLGLTMSGFGFWSHDVGGFEDTGGYEGAQKEALFNRWVAFGLFSSHSRLHGSNSYRVPWLYGSSSSAILSKFVQAKHQLMPYIYQTAIEAHQTGVPVQRAMVLEFSDDPTTHYLDRQYMFGPSLLVAPIFNIENTAEFYLPKGTWTSFWDASIVHEGPKWVTEKNVPFDYLPVFVRPNTILPLGPSNSPSAAYAYAESPLTLRAYALADGAREIVIPSGKGTEAGARLKVRKGEEGLEVDVLEGKVGQWTVEVC